MNESKTSKIKLNDWWPYRAVVLADQISRHTSSLAKEKAGLNLSQWRVLAAVAEKPGRTAAEVTKVTPMDKSIVSRAVASLITIGLIKKAHSTEDRRRLSLTVTCTGLDLYEEIAVQLKQDFGCSPQNGPSPETFIQSLKAYSSKISDLNAETE